MKKSYTLFGVIWDNIDISKTIMHYVEYEYIKDIVDYHYPQNLFDSQEYNRTISLRELLSFNDNLQLSKVVSQLQICDNLYILNDYIPKYYYPTLCNFLTKRMMQMYALLQQQLPNTKVYLSQYKHLENTQDSKKRHKKSLLTSNLVQQTLLKLNEFRR